MFRGFSHFEHSTMDGRVNRMKSNISRKKVIAAGTVLFREGDPGGSGFFLESGQVEIWVNRADKRVILGMLTDGEFVGELSAFDLAPRSASATAVKDCVVVEFNHEQLNNRIQAMDPVMSHLIGSLVERIRATNVQINDGFESDGFLVAKAASRRALDQTCLNELTLEADLLQAVNNDEFQLHFQPIIDINQMKLAGFEALIRWHHPKRGLVRPDQFIPFAEDNNLITNITRWCVDEICQQAPEFQLAALHNPEKVQPLFLTVNLSGRDVGCAEFGEWIEGAILNSHCPPEMLKLEVTESSLMENMDTAKQMLSRLRDMGVGVAIDDFGTGHSNLAYLCELPITTLKIDRSLVTGKPESNRNLDANKPILKLVMGLANDLGVTVVAEGVEDTCDLSMLQVLGCDFAQGYLFSKPLPAAEALELVRSWDWRDFQTENEMAQSA